MRGTCRIQMRSMPPCSGRWRLGCYRRDAAPNFKPLTGVAFVGEPGGWCRDLFDLIPPDELHPLICRASHQQAFIKVAQQYSLAQLTAFQFERIGRGR
jgi:hypothetical protein